VNPIGTRLPAVLLAGLLAACPAKEQPAPTPAPSPEATPAAGAPDASTKIDIEAARARGKTAMFVPAPSEFQAALKASAPDIKLASSTMVEMKALDGKARPMIALETGRRMAWVLLAVADEDKGKTLTALRGSRDGLKALGAGDDVLGDVDKLIADYEGDKVTTKELAPTMDLLAGKLQDSLEQGAGKDVATLVEAGGWVQGVNLLATALAAKGLTGDAAALLHQPTVLAYFLQFIKDSAAAKSNDEAVMAVITEMDKLTGIAGKADLTVEDLNAVAGHTAAILAKL
jgi:hypothetical protein